MPLLSCRSSCFFHVIFAKIFHMSKNIEAGEIVVLVTVPNEDMAATIAKALVEARLAACANLIKGIRSIYTWQGKVEDEQEVLMIIKTQMKLFDGLKAKVKEIHSYEVPEIIALPIAAGSEDYLNWLRRSTA